MLLAYLRQFSYPRVATLDKSENSFTACGLYPSNPHVFPLEDFSPAQVLFIQNRRETVSTTVILHSDKAFLKPSTSNIPDPGVLQE
jgi:hypothetical protein